LDEQGEEDLQISFSAGQGNSLSKEQLDQTNQRAIDSQTNDSRLAIEKIKFRRN